MEARSVGDRAHAAPVPIVGAAPAPVAPDADGGADAAAPLPAPPATLVSITDRAAGGSLGLTRIHAPQELPVLGADGTTQVTLADVVGRRAEGTKSGDGVRVGAEAWSEVRYTWAQGDVARRRAFLENVQSVLNRRLAVPIAWAVSSTATGGEYRAEGASEWTITGLHESILVDYEVDGVPGYGTFRVDVRETRPDALEATLADDANVRFFRIKNSWGVDPAWTEEEMRQYGMLPDPDGGAKAKPNYLPSKPGFDDLFTAYLDLPKQMNDTRDAHVALRLALPSKLRFAIPDAAPSSDAGTDAAPDAAVGKR